MDQNSGSLTLLLKMLSEKWRVTAGLTANIIKLSYIQQKTINTIPEISETLCMYTALQNRQQDYFT